MCPALGIYVSIPFCRAKCTYCNFASGVFGPERLDAYIDHLCAEIAGARSHAAELAAELPAAVDTIYLGGGTPSLLSPAQVRRIFALLRTEFHILTGAEITLECAPGQLSPETLEELQEHDLNRISFGVQSFSDIEAKAVGRAHTRELCLAEIARMRAAGIPNLNVDLIAGLPHQTGASWLDSVNIAITSGVPHVSVYMLEVDQDSRLGREVLATGSRYGAATIATEDEIADRYGEAGQLLEEAGIGQYEISNFARPGFACAHNLKYWQRKPYIGFGLDAHSMLLSVNDHPDLAVRWANTDDLDSYLQPIGASTAGLLHVLSSASAARTVDRVSATEAFEESVFLGLRMNRGIDLNVLTCTFGEALVHTLLEQLADPEQAGLLERTSARLRLTPKGRMVSNEVFGRVLIPGEPVKL